MKHLLYSTNVYLKHWVQEKYWDGTHYVWCSEHFDNPPGLHLPPSANPANIYKRLKDDIAGRDTHSEKIAQQKASLVELATRWSDNGQIKPTDCEEILFKVETAAWEDWKPLIYVIPRALLEARMKPVPIAKRASSQANEYIISDLHRNEFEVIEL